MTPATLEALAARVEAASGPDRELDALIAAACRHALPKGGEWALRFPKWEGAPNTSGEVRIIGNVNGNGNYIAGTFRAPTYSASLDAAMTLLPQGFMWLVQSWPDGVNEAILEKNAGEFGAIDARHTGTFAATPALALTAAALRARAATLSQDTDHD